MKIKWNVMKWVSSDFQRLIIQLWLCPDFMFPCPSGMEETPVI